MACVTVISHLLSGATETCNNDYNDHDVYTECHVVSCRVTPTHSLQPGQLPQPEGDPKRLPTPERAQAPHAPAPTATGAPHTPARRPPATGGPHALAPAAPGQTAVGLALALLTVCFMSQRALRRCCGSMQHGTQPRKTVNTSQFFQLNTLL